MRFLSCLVILLSLTSITTLADITPERFLEIKAQAEKGVTSAQRAMGLIYFTGQGGIPKDYAEAAKWLQYSSEKGDAVSQYYLAQCYYMGQGLPKNYIEGFKWYKKAAEQGIAGAQCAVAGCYSGHGNVVAQDNDEAIKWYKKAAGQGYLIAQCALGSIYSEGKITTKDLVEAYAYYNLASANNSFFQKDVLRLERQMTQEQITKGQKRSTELYTEMAKQKNPNNFQ